MMIHKAVSLASLAWSFGVIALVLPRLPLVAPPSEPIALPAASPGDMAVLIQRHAQRFSSAGVGYAGLTPNEVMAWRVIFFRTGGESTFVRLLDDATPAGQLYALAGLRFAFANEELFAKAAARLARRTDRVHVIRGCIGFEASVAELVAEIRKGEWVRDYLRGTDWRRRS